MGNKHSQFQIPGKQKIFLVPNAPWCPQSYAKYSWIDGLIISRFHDVTL